MTIPREICKVKRRRFAPLSFLATNRDVVLVWGETSRDPRQETYVHPRWIYARYICFKVPNSRTPHPPPHPFGSMTSPFSFRVLTELVPPSAAAVLPFRRSAVPLPRRRVFMRAGWQKGGNTRAGVMARISALDLEQRFSVEDGSTIRISPKMTKERKKYKIERKMGKVFRTLRMIGNTNNTKYYVVILE